MARPPNGGLQPMMSDTGHLLAKFALLLLIEPTPISRRQAAEVSRPRVSNSIEIQFFLDKAKQNDIKGNILRNQAQVPGWLGS